PNSCRYKLSDIKFFPNTFQIRRTYVEVSNHVNQHESNNSLIINRLMESRKRLNSSWNENEVGKLLDAVVEHGTNWKTIWEQYFKPNRNPGSLRGKWERMYYAKQRPSYHNPWTPEENKILADGVAKYGVGKWAQISKLFVHRDRHQVKNHWIDILYRNRGKWTPEEDKLLLKLVNQFGVKWTLIGKHMNRARNDIYSRYYILIRKEWTKDENQMLQDLIAKHGENWKIISEHFSNRSVYDIKMHYKQCSSINPKVNKGRWTAEEIKAFNEAFLKFGKKWKHVAELVGTRTSGQ
ncbi:4904_t:CDS:1, partial [Cetraspora pellucida]